MKKLLISALTVASLAVAAPAFAHSMVKSSNITADAVLETAPTSFDIVFAHKVGLAKIGIETPLGEVIEIDYTAPKGMGDTFSVPLPELDGGDYVLTWRAVAKDGHVMSGNIPFSIE